MSWTFRIVAGPLLLLLFAASCTSEPERPDSLVIGAVGDALSLDPAAISDTESVEVAMQVFEQLVRYEKGSTRVEPALATHWTVSNGGRVWTFHLRREVYFHDGTPLNADAVVFSFERQRDRDHPYHFGGFTYWESSFRQINEVRKVDAHTVRIQLDRPYAPFLANLAMSPASIISPTAMKLYGRDFASHPVGTGPYRFVGWDKGERIVLGRNPSYWDKAPKVDRLVFEAIPEESRRLVGLQSGVVDVVHGLAPADRQIVRLHPELQLYRTPGNNVAYVAMNTSRAPFDELQVRQAVNCAIDRHAIVKLAYQGLAVQASGPIPPVMWSRNEKTRRYPYNPAKARQMLEESGYDFDRRLSFHVMSTSRSYLPNPELVGEMIARNLAMVGMQVDLVVRPFREHQRATQMGEHDLCLAGWAGDNGDPDNFLYLLLDRDNARRGAARNLAMFSNDDLHRTLVRAQQSLDRRVRKRLYRQAQVIVADQAPWVPLAHTDVVVAARRAVEDLHVHPSNVIFYSRVIKR